MTKKNGNSTTPALSIEQTCDELRRIQRQRSVVIKSVNMQSNRLQAVVAGTIGYSSSMAEKDRRAKFKEAAALIKAIDLGDHEDYTLRAVVIHSLVGIKALRGLQDALDKELVQWVRQLPVGTPGSGWVNHIDQRGFGEIFLGAIVGEAGDLANYANPMKLWRRLSCAPWTFDTKTLMGATWRGGKEGKLPAAEWEAYGYSPRRRSITYLVGEGIVKQNGKGPYRSKYLQAKAAVALSHPEWDWKKCEGCSGKGHTPEGPCNTCGGSGKGCLRAHRHAMLVATKLLLKRLWVVWNNKPDRCPTWGAW